MSICNICVTIQVLEGIAKGNYVMGMNWRCTVSRFFKKIFYLALQMSSSFVKDCSDVSAPGNNASGKTVIIIVNNETGNVSLDGSELQNLLGKIFCPL